MAMHTLLRALSSHTDIPIFRHSFTLSHPGQRHSDSACLWHSFLTSCGTVSYSQWSQSPFPLRGLLSWSRHTTTVILSTARFSWSHVELTPQCPSLSVGSL